MNSPNQKLVSVRVDTFHVLQRIRLDESYQTYDHIVREALKRVYPRYAFDL